MRYPHDPYSEEGTPTDASHLLDSKVNISSDGHLKVFGKEFDVGQNGAILLRPLVDTLISQVSIRGAAYAARWGTGLSGLVMPKHWAAKTGKGIGFVWLFGLSLSDVVLGVKKTVNDGFKDMHELRDKWQPLLAANNNMDVSVGKALTCNCGVFAHARAKVYENGKRNLLGTIAGGIRAIPTMLMGVYQHQLNNTPKGILQARYHKGWSREERKETWDLMQALKSQQQPIRPRRRNQKDDLISTLSRLFTDRNSFNRLRHPKNEQDLRDNIQDLTLMPALFGLGGDLIERHITKSGKEETEDAGDKILELQAYVHNHDQPDRDRVAVFIKDIFQQRARDLGRKYEIEGDTFDRVTDAVADAVVYGLHPQAVAEALDNKKIVTFGLKDADFGEMEDVKAVLEALKEKYTSKVSEKQFYKNAPFTRESLVQTFKEMPEKEKPFFVMLFPPGILEKAGVDKAAVKKYREEGKQSFVDELTGMTKFLMEAGREELKERGMKSKVIDEFEAFKTAFLRAENNDHGDEFMEKGTAKAARVVRDVALSAKNPHGLWQDYLKRRGSESAANNPAGERTPMDHAERDPDEEIGVNR